MDFSNSHFCVCRFFAFSGFITIIGTTLKFIMFHRRLLLSLFILLSYPNGAICYIFTGSSINYDARKLSQTPVVIAPGFMNEDTDYYPRPSPFGYKQEGDHHTLDADDTSSLVSSLIKRGFDPELIHVVPMMRSDWFRVMNGLWDQNTYKGLKSRVGKATCPNMAYGWYLQRMKDTIDKAYVKGNAGSSSGGDNRVLVLAHSAGGWLARAALGDGLWRPHDDAILLPNKARYTVDRICCLATMGGLHKSPVNAFPFFTRGAIVHTNTQYPGAYLKRVEGGGIGYVSIGSDGIVGCDKHNKAAYASYELVCGQGDVVGDGIIPFEWTKLDGAREVKLDNILHSFTGLPSSPNTDHSQQRWYGADTVIDQWLPEVLEEAGLAP